MTNIAILSGNTVIYWNQIIIVLGVIAGLLFASVMSKTTKIRFSIIITWTILFAVISAIFARLLHWYFNGTVYSTFGDFFNLSVGGFVVVGLVPGAIVAALICKRLFNLKNIGKLLDCTTPGVIIFLAMFRLSCMFTNVWHSKDAITSPVFQRLPFAVAATDNAGNTTYTFAASFVSFIFLVVILAAGLMFFTKRKKLAPGDSARFSLVLMCAVEIVLDSTRNDQTKLQFRLLQFLNKYVGFISLSMIGCAICLICLLVHYIKAVRKNGKKNNHCGISVILFVIGIAIVGIFEYLLQRYSVSAIPFHLIQFIGCAAMAYSILLLIFKKTSGQKRIEKRKRIKRVDY